MLLNLGHLRLHCVAFDLLKIKNYDTKKINKEAKVICLVYLLILSLWFSGMFKDNQ